MEKNENLQPYKIIIAVLILLLGLTGFWGYRESVSKKEVIVTNTELIEKTDGLVALRDELAREVDSLENAYNSLAEENVELKGSLAAANDRAAQSQRALANERKSNAGQINNLKAELQALLDTKRRLENNIAELQEENENLKALAGELRQDLGVAKKENEALANLNRTMEGEIKKLTLANFKASAFEVTLEQRNTKATSKSRRGRRLNVSFDLTAVPSEYQGIRPLYLVITDEKATPIQMEGAKRVKVIINGQEIDLFAAETRNMSLVDNQRINFNHTLEDKLKSGYYRASVYTDIGLLGASNFRIN
jgi:hypothetical protein